MRTFVIIYIHIYIHILCTCWCVHLKYLCGCGHARIFYVSDVCMASPGYIRHRQAIRPPVKRNMVLCVAWCVFIYVCAFYELCMYVYIYIYIYKYIHTYIHNLNIYSMYTRIHPYGHSYTQFWYTQVCFASRIHDGNAAPSFDPISLLIIARFKRFGSISRLIIAQCRLGSPQCRLCSLIGDIISFI
jgi:hypothetical protein